LKQSESVAGVVRWAEDNMVGVMFNHPVDVVQLLTDSSVWPRPRQPRVEVQSIVWLEQNGKSYVGRAVDIAQGGMKLRSNSPLNVDEPLTITLRELPPLRARVRWTSGELNGLVFEEPLSLKALVGWVRKQQAAMDGADRAGEAA
jgi:hypothetical protein